MSIICAQCGRTIETEGVAFCPYCGEKLPAAGRNNAAAGSREAEEWVWKALAVSGIPARKKIQPITTNMKVASICNTSFHEGKRRFTAI